MKDVQHTPRSKEEIFKPFPEFGKLTLDDRFTYERALGNVMGVSDVQFYSLMLHWSALDVNTVSALNGNVILSYWLAGADKLNGISIIGTNDIDETICEIFDTQIARNETPRVAHVPEFVVEQIKHPNMFSFESERYMDEYIIDLSRHAMIENMTFFARQRLNRFYRSVHKQGASTSVRLLDVSNDADLNMLMDSIKFWKTKGFINNIVRHINENLGMAVEASCQLGLSVIGLFVNDDIKAFMVFHDSDGVNPPTLTHVLINDDQPYVYDGMLHEFAKWFVSRGNTHINADSDLGIPLLRAVKLALRPTNFYRKYTITPLQGSGMERVI